MTLLFLLKNAKIKESNRRDKIRSDKIRNGDRLQEGNTITSTKQKHNSTSHIRICLCETFVGDDDEGM
jgi:hypothetical protein